MTQRAKDEERTRKQCRTRISHANETECREKPKRCKSKSEVGNTSCSINRESQDPEMFIKVLLAFATLPAKKPGWDPTIRIYQSRSRGRNREPIPSYKMAPTDKDFQTDSYQVNWVISMPTKGDPNQREDFVTLQAAIAASTYDLCTPGTIVWQVVKLKDFKEGNANKKDRRIRSRKVAKDPDQKPFEAEMYDAAGMGDRVYSSEDLDESCTLKIRDGLNAESLHKATEWNERFQTLMLRSRSAQERTESQKPFTYLNCAEPPDYGPFTSSTRHFPDRTNPIIIKLDTDDSTDARKTLKPSRHRPPQPL
ncbi:hypothetical protein F5887DRAFT_919840 [Amanita rubescens]|nr:hypothetical protein F5887DRAFT_919840 [Amanita rubescens]